MQTVTLGSLGVNAITPVNLAATDGHISKITTLTVTPASLLSIYSNLSTLKGGGTFTLILRLNGHAGSNGVTVNLQSSDSSVASVPASIKMAGNTASYAFPVASKAVQGTKTVTFTASSGRVTKTCTVSFTP